MRLAITILVLSAFAHASDWQTGKVEVHPTIVKDMFADYPGHLYRESQAGYTCMDGDADNAPVCISDEHSTVVVTSGYATVTLADALQFQVPDYTQAGLIYDPQFIIQDDMYCMDNVYRPKGIGYITSGYQCTIFKRLVLKLTFPGGLGFTFQGKPTEQKTFTFQYRLAKSRKGGEQEIDIKGVGKGLYIAQTPSSSPTLAAPGNVADAAKKTVASEAASLEQPKENAASPRPIFVQCCRGPPRGNVDGTIYVEYEMRNVNNNVVTSDSLYLQQVDLNNNWPSTLLSSTSGQNQLLLPGPIIPDGQGGVLATWTIASSLAIDPPVLQYPYQAVDVVSGVVGTPYNLPFSPASVTFGQSPTIVLGQNGDGIATNGTDAVNGPVVASFSLTSGSVNWSYQGTAGDTLSIVQATVDGGVTINDSSTGVIQLSSTGSPELRRAGRRKEHGSIAIAGVSSALQGAVPLDLSTWISTAGGAFTALWSPDGSNNIPTILAQTVYPMAKGNGPGQSLPPFCQRKNVNCALAPHDDIQVGPNQETIQVRQVTYWLFNLQNGTLSPLEGPSVTPPPVKIEEWENASGGAQTCTWQTTEDECESPNTRKDGPGQLTDNMGAILTPFTVQQQFLVDRQGVQVFWPNSNGSWYGAWGTPSSPPPGFQPNQTASVTVGWATISQINANTNAPTACAADCDTMLPQAGPPQQ